MNEHLLEIKITQPGRAIGQYYAPDSSTLRLEKIIYRDESLPFDVGILPTALTSFDEPFAVFVLGTLSHPIGTEIESKLLGALQRGDEVPLLLVAPTADERAPQCLDSICAEQRSELIRILHQTRPGEWRWLTVEEVEPHLHIGALRQRHHQADGKLLHLDAAWQPIDINRPSASYAEAERYTAAEYTFYELPYRFQHYVSEYLAPDERILYASRRPAVFSHRKRSWLRSRVHLQEGVLILTSQRLIQLVELVPPDSANIRYGFHTIAGVVEQLAEVTLTPLGSNLLLQTKWRAVDGEVAIEWEAPEDTRTSLDELVALLSRFQTNADACVLRRATPPVPPEKLPALTDNSLSDPSELIPINEQFSTALAQSLAPGEQTHAWAFLPKWSQAQKVAQALVVTERRIFLLPDGSSEIPLTQIAALEYTGSILESSLAINFIDNGKARRKTIFFPYPAQDSFRTCFEAARRCMTVLPLL